MMTAQQLLVHFFTEHSTDILDKLSLAAFNSQCEVVAAESRVLLGRHLGFFQVRGSWSVIAKFEHQLQHLSKAELDCVEWTRSSDTSTLVASLPYVLQIQGPTQLQTLAAFLDFLKGQGLSFVDLFVENYAAPYSSMSMQLIEAVILIPSTQNLGNIREAFLLFCEAYNLDAIFEPKRN